MKEKLVAVRRRMPRWLRLLYAKLKVAHEFVLDYRSHSETLLWNPKVSGRSESRDDNEYLTARLTVLSHGLEKGMTFPKPRRPFGTRRIFDIHELINSADEAKLEIDTVDALSAAAAVEAFNEGEGVDPVVSPASNWTGQPLDPAEVEAFVRSRHSIRNFDLAAGISRETITEIVRLAGLTPSVCNRRSYRVHFYDEIAKIREILALQNGNRGFVESIPGVMIVTERRADFVGAGERNQRWVDGGLFSMSLVWLCHAFGVGSCFLNWSQTHAQTRKLRRVAGISEAEDVIVLIAVGRPAKGHHVARSPQRALRDILVVH